jgi:hypothetical protein
MRMLRKMTRRRSVSILSILFVLALTTTTALAAKARFSSLASFTLVSSSTGSTFAATMHHEPPSTPILLAAHGDLEGLTDGQQYKVEISAKGKAEVVCVSGYDKPSPKTIPISAKGSTTVSSYAGGSTSFDVVADSLKINANTAGCSSGHHGHDQSHVIVVKVMYRNVGLALSEVGSHGKLDTQHYSNCKTKEEMVRCQQSDSDDPD